MRTEILKGPESDAQYQNLTFHHLGGMGEIYLAVDVINSIQVAVKIIKVTDDDYRELLQEEFQIALSLEHENIVKTYYFGEFSEVTGNYFYSVMEYLPKGNLHQVIKANNAFFTQEECLNMFYDLLKGLQEAHKKIVHRDLKPLNVLVDNNGKLKICDFGIAKYVDHLTRTKTFKGFGTYPYMAPECWTIETNSREMDIYSLGIIFFEILTKQLPFKGPLEKDFKEQHLYAPLPQILDIRKDAPITVIDIIRRMTNKPTTERFHTVEEIINDFDKVTEYAKRNTLDVSSFLTKVNKRVSAEAEAKLKEQKAEEAYRERQRNFSYAIDQMFNKFISVIDTINNLPGSDKITYAKDTNTKNAAASNFILNFFGKQLTVSFYKEDTITNYIVEWEKAYMAEQLRINGYAYTPVFPQFIEIDKALLLGKAELHSSEFKDRPSGFNIVLRKMSDEDIYGAWWICKFSNRINISKAANDHYFFFDPNEFFDEYQIGRQRTMHIHKFDFKNLEEADILNLIEKIV